MKSIICLLDSVEKGVTMLIQPAYISYWRRNKRWSHFKLKKKHVDEPIFENSSSSGEEIHSENDDSDSEAEHDGEGMSLRDINKLVNHPLTKLVEQVIKDPEDALRRLVPVNEVIKHPLVSSIKGAGFTKEEGPMVCSDADSDDAEIEDMDGEIEDELGEPDAKVAKIEDFGCFDDFQRAGKHTPSRIPSTAKRKYVQRICVGCRRNGIRRDTCHYCKDCSDSPALCKDCFDTYHSGYNMNE